MKHLNDNQIQIILDCYVKEGKGQSYTAKQAGISVEALKKFLFENGIHIRTQKEAAIQSNINRTFKKNIQYFDKQSHNMAWILGFLAADGTIRKDSNQIKLTVADKDKEILEKIRAEIGIENEVKSFVTKNGYESCTLAWTCKEHKNELSKYNIVPQKTFLLTPPYSLDREFWIDYIRGYFDGDGSINLIKNSNGRGNGNLRWQLCSATKSIIEWVMEVFESYGIPKVQIQSRIGEHTLYMIQYSCAATRQIYSILYNDSSMFLKRKRDHYEEILQKVRPIK